MGSLIAWQLLAKCVCQPLSPLECVVGQVATSFHRQRDVTIPCPICLYGNSCPVHMSAIVTTRVCGRRSSSCLIPQAGISELLYQTCYYNPSLHYGMSQHMAFCINSS